MILSSRPAGRSTRRWRFAVQLAALLAIATVRLPSLLGLADGAGEGSTIEVIARGSTGDEIAELRVDGVAVSTLDVETVEQSFGYVSLEPVRPSQIQIAFVNDQARPVDRNLTVDAIVVDGVRYETEDPAVYSTGTYSSGSGCAPGNKGSEALHCNGSFQYADVEGTPSAAPAPEAEVTQTASSGTAAPAPTGEVSDVPEGIRTPAFTGAGPASTIEVIARGTTGDEVAELQLDGIRVASFPLGTTLQTHRYDAPGSVSADQVRVAFGNDQYRPVDRNLTVDAVVIDGVRYETESPTTFSTGTYRSDSGCGPGNKSSQTLHCNGYLQYSAGGASSTQPAQPEPTPPAPSSTVAPTTATTPSGGAKSVDATADSLVGAGVNGGVRVGVAVEPSRLATQGALIAREFGQITPENAAKWKTIESTRGQYNFGPMDQVVDFADQRGLEVRGHTLIWGQATGNAQGLPSWVANIGSAGEMRSVMERYITDVVGRYEGRIERWDVVNEPFSYKSNSLDNNRFHQLLGEQYIDIAFRAAQLADPSAELWLNEISAEQSRGKADALVALVDRLRARGVPLHGVGIQTHLFNGTPAPELAYVTSQLRARGLRVAITELDVTITSTPEAQAEVYRTTVSQFLAAGGEEVTIWGVRDSDSWLVNLRGAGSRPLLFDDSLQRKPAYYAVRSVIDAN